MAIKATVNDPNAKAKELPFPKLMVSEAGRIVLMIERGVGLQINADGVGPQYSDSWDMSKFTDFHGSITLSNDKESQS